MSKHLLISFVGLLAIVLALSQNQPADASFHFMRIYAVMGGAFGNDDIQYVELRLASAGQNLVANKEICFFDAGGTARYRFSFPSSTSNDTNDASILVGTSTGTGFHFDNVWPGPTPATDSPDFNFAGDTTSLAGGTDPDHPVFTGSGKVTFGDDDGACGFVGGLTLLVDSVAYGSGYTGGTNFCTKFTSDLPIAGTQTLKLDSAVTYPPTCDAGAADYSLVDANVTANNPRDSTGSSGPLVADTDDDGVLDGSDNCMTTANAFQGNQDTPADTLGDACDPDSDNDTVANTSDLDDDNDKVFDVDEGECRDDVDGADANTLVNDGCPQIGPTGESGAQCTSSTDSDADGYINDGCPGASEPVACGGDPLSPARKPERLDTVGDDDADGATNEGLPAGSSGFDCDGDGWKGNQENLIYNDAPGTGRDQDPCGNNGWPADLDPDNKLNIGDINSVTTPSRPSADHNYSDSHGAFNKFGHPLDDANNGTGLLPPDGIVDPLMARWNLDNPPHLAGTTIDIGDLNAVNPGVAASTASPPMFGGLPAFFTNGGQCPYAP